MYFDTIFDLLQYYKNNLNINDKVSISANVHSENLNFNIYRLPDSFTFNSSSNIKNIFSLCTKEDANTQVIIGKSITISSNVTFTTPYRCKGLIIFCESLTNNGIISMTARGAKGDGNNIYLCNLNGTYQIVPKNGALGADRQEDTAKWEGPWARGSGYNGTGRQTGGGANGASGHGDGDHWSTTIHEGGGQGSSYSGGAGSGGCDLNYPGTFTIPKPNPGTGAGTDGYGARWAWWWYDRNGGGGAGNPGGRGRYASGYNSSLDGESGTGGLIILFATNIVGNGTYQAKGSNGGGGSKGGGGSGGGSINIFTATGNKLASSLFNVDGGGSKSNGGKGGNGTASVDVLILLDNTLFNVNYLTHNLNNNNYTLYCKKNISNYSEIETIDILGFYFDHYDYHYNNDHIDVNYYYNRNSYNLILNNGISKKYTYLYEEIGDLKYIDNTFNNYLLKFKNWKSEDSVEIYRPYIRNTTFKMPAHNISIYAEYTEQDRVNTNIYKNIFENILFDLYKSQKSLNNNVYNQKTNIFQYKHQLNLYDLVYIDNNGLYKKGLANENQYNVIGIISEVINQNEFTLLTFGQIETNYDFNSDSGILYLSDTEPGKFCTYEELTTDFYTPIGFYTGNTITISILDSSVGDVLKKYYNRIYEQENFTYLTESEKQNIIQEVLNNA